MNNQEAICAQITLLTRQLLNKTNESTGIPVVNIIRDESGTKSTGYKIKIYAYKLLKKCETCNTNLTTDRAKIIIQDFVFLFHQKEPLQWLQSNNCVKEFYALYTNFLYYIDVLRCHRELQNNIDQDNDWYVPEYTIKDSSPLDCPPEIRSNCLYTILLQLYNRWIQHKLNNPSEKFYVSLTDKHYDVENINKVMYEIHYVLTRYTPKYNPDTYLYILWLDGQGCEGCSSEIYTNDTVNDRFGKHLPEELLCIKCQSIYLEPNQEEIAISILGYFKHKIRNTYVALDYCKLKLFTYSDQLEVVHYTGSDASECKKNQKVLTSTINVSDVYKFQKCFLDTSPVLDYNVIEELQMCTVQPMTSKFTVIIGLCVKTFVFNVSIACHGDSESRNVSLEEFFNLATTTDLLSIKFEEAPNNYQYVHELNIYSTVFFHLYKIIFEPFFKYKKFQVFKNIALQTQWLTTDIVNYILPEYF